MYPHFLTFEASALLTIADFPQNILEVSPLRKRSHHIGIGNFFLHSLLLGFHPLLAMPPTSHWYMYSVKLILATRVQQYIIANLDSISCSFHDWGCTQRPPQ